MEGQMKTNGLKALRKRLGFRQAEVAEVAHCSRALIISIERLKHYPSPAVRQRIAAALGVSETLIWPDAVGVGDSK